MLRRWSRLALNSPAVALVLALLAAPACSGDDDDDDDNSDPPQGAVISVSPDAVDFGETVLVGTQGSLELTVSNDGDAPLNISQYILDGLRFYTDVTPGAVAPGDSVTVEITFKPNSVEEQTGSLTIVSDATNEPNKVVAVTGTGQSPDNDHDGQTQAEGDCNDNNPDINSDANEVCDKVDNDCNGQIDDGADGVTQWYTDADKDGFGDKNDRRPDEACQAPSSSYADNNLDCNDADAGVNPEAAEVCGDTLDSNCDGDPNDGFDLNGDSVADCLDQDRDGFTGEQGDCNDTNAGIHPTALELPDNGIDENCNGETDENTGPSITIATPTDGETVDPGTVTISVLLNDTDPFEALSVDFSTSNATSGAAYELCLDVIPDSSGVASCDAVLEYGVNDILIVGEDSEGASTEESLNLIVDTRPTINILAPSNGTTVPYGEPVQFTIQVTDPEEAEAFAAEDVQWASTEGGPLTVDRILPSAPGTISVAITLPVPGDQIVTATVTDTLGGTGTAPVQLVVEAPDCGASDVVALWHMDEGNGSVITDEVTGMTGSLEKVNFATGQSSSFDTALSFAGAGSLVTIADPSDLLSLETFTADLWYRFPASGPQAPQTSGKQSLLYKNGDTTGDKPNYYISINSSSLVEVMVARSGGAPGLTDLRVTGKTEIKSNAWYYIAVTFDGRFLRLYVNGYEDGQLDAGTGGVVPPTGRSPLYIGSNVDAQQPQRPGTLTGLVDDVQIMSCPLLASQISEYYRMKLPHTDPVADEPTPTP